MIIKQITLIMLNYCELNVFKNRKNDRHVLFLASIIAMCALILHYWIALRNFNAQEQLLAFQLLRTIQLLGRD